MLTLIVRELYDHIAYSALAALLSLITIGVIIYTVLLGLAEASFVFAMLVMQGLLMVFCSLGTAQMYADRANRISALLATLAVTRNRIFAAKVIAGAIVILLTLIPVVLVAVVLLHLFAPLSFYGHLVFNGSVTAFLMALACYCAGLQVGWTGNKIVPVAGTLVLFVLIAPLLLIKGFGTEAIVILLLLDGAMLLRAWKNYTAASL